MQLNWGPRHVHKGAFQNILRLLEERCKTSGICFYNFLECNQGGSDRNVAYEASDGGPQGKAPWLAVEDARSAPGIASILLQLL